MKKTDQLEKVLKKFKLEEPAPPHVQKRIRRAKKRMAVAILKKKGRYTVWMSLVLSGYFIARSLGIALTATQSAVVVMIAAFSTAAIITTGGYIAVKKVFFDSEEIMPPDKTEQAETLPPLHRERQPVPAHTKNSKVTGPYIAEIIAFKSDNEARHINRALNKALTAHLRDYSGGKRIRLTGPGSQQKTTKYIVLGSCFKIEKVFIITVKLMEQDTSVIRAIMTEEIRSENEIDSVSKRIAFKLAEKL